MCAEGLYDEANERQEKSNTSTGVAGVQEKKGVAR
jgi:hypothetical protein